MKVNLIYDMRHDDSGMFGGLSEEDKEDAVIAVLESSRNSVEFKKIVDGVENPKKPFREKVLVDDLLDFSQQDRFNQLKIKFNYSI